MGSNQFWIVTVLALLLAAGLGFANIERVRNLGKDLDPPEGMDRTPPIWIVDAIPAALSSQLFESPADYTALRAVRDRFYADLKDQFRNSNSVDHAIAAVRSLDRAAISRETVLLGGDDKGIVDFIKISFHCFGYSSRTIIYLYFLLLYTSVFLAIISFQRVISTVLVAEFFLAAHYLFLPAVFYDLQLQSVLALRFLPVLSLIATWHCLLFIQRAQWTVGRCIAVLAQVCLLLFVIHLRSVAIWEAWLIVLFGVAKAGVGYFKRPSDGGIASSRQAVLFPVMAILAGLIALNLYHRTAYNEAYRRGDQIATRPFWHNILSGFAFNPVLAREYELKVDDFSELKAVHRFLASRGRESEWKAMGGDSPGFSRIRWVDCDPAEGELLRSIVYRHPGEVMLTALYYKPKSFLKHIAWLYGFRHQLPDVGVFVSPDVGEGMANDMGWLQARLNALGLRFVLWDRIAVATLLACVLLFILARGMISDIDWLPLGVLAVGSMIPVFVGYPSMLTIAESAIVLPTALYTVVAAVLGDAFAAAAKCLFSRGLSGAPNKAGRSAAG